VTIEPERYPYLERISDRETVSLVPILPFTLIGTNSVSTMALLDTGSATNVLPYQLGVQLGGIWEKQTFIVRLTGSLAAIEARGLVLSARIGNFPVVSLAFAWAKSDAIPILLGQMNFFLEFDVCFHRSRSFFEVCPRPDPSPTNPD
jgi:hypothetical protein